MAVPMMVLILLGIHQVDEGISKTFVNRNPEAQITLAPGAWDLFVGGEIWVCARIHDPDGDRLRVRWTAKRQRSHVGPHGSYFKKFAPERSYGRCGLYHAPSTQGWDTVTISVKDGRGGQFAASAMFCILPDDFGGSVSQPPGWYCPKR